LKIKSEIDKVRLEDLKEKVYNETGIKLYLIK